MNFKNVIFFLYLFVHLYTANAGICEDPSELARLYERIEDENRVGCKDAASYYLMKLLYFATYPLADSLEEPHRTGGVTKATIWEYISEPNARKDFGISESDERKILDTVWEEEMSKKKFIRLITIKAKLTYEQLAKIYTDVFRESKKKIEIRGHKVWSFGKVDKKRVKKYLIREKNQYNLSENDVENITAPLRDCDMGWHTFYRLII
ncbi:uncharacterized protein LOC126843511 [Adelges cooleyi]|uniref:uncharacterized protein LOC126843511 n=1 Tax=Adelges cooleyi TaxID=133065 RepID=UPI00217FB2C3|nr:uncharacterized protein LOC126843511 [Adelges cooleyi]